MNIEQKDAPARACLEKCRELMAEKPDHWDGTWVMTKKMMSGFRMNKFIDLFDLLDKPLSVHYIDLKLQNL